MRRVVVWALLFGLVASFGGCKSSTVSEVALEPPPQTKPRDARLARLYFLREKGLVGAEVGIKVDGKPVGSVTKGFYFFSEKPPGRYRIACVNPIMMDYEIRNRNRGWKNLLFRHRYAPGGSPRSKSSQSGACRQQRTANAADVRAHGRLFRRRPLSNRRGRGSCHHQSVEAAIAWVIGGVGDPIVSGLQRPYALDPIRHAISSGSLSRWASAFWPVLPPPHGSQHSFSNFKR